ncbi:MAG: Hsp20/alpha crystallin family protein [Desulfuromonadales bacterium]|nr:Hsp20/alpha crystallin family protein [Desulfuromonadales bacterium]
MPRRELMPWRRRGEMESGRTEEMWPMRRAFESMFDDFFRGFPRMGMMEEMFGGGTMPRINMEETEGAYRIDAELPGVEEKDIDVSVRGNMLTIRGERREEKTEKEKGQEIFRECRYGNFERTLQLPMEVDIDRINATYRSGVLHIELPKTAEAKEKVKKIEVH